MPRIRAAEPAREHSLAEAEILIQGRHHPLSRAAVTRAARRVLDGERRRATLSLTFVSREQMRALNARWKGADQPTDVLAFALAGPGDSLAGDVYICPWVAAREARSRTIPLAQELRRLVVHGVLHVLGYDHPEGDRRTASAMWRRQERYLRSLR
jgi:probable rRNA maturation factor